MNIRWEMAGRDDHSEIKRTFRFVFMTNVKTDVKGNGFTCFFNTPWVSISASWNAETNYSLQRLDGFIFLWGRNKGWSKGISDRNFYKHSFKKLSRLR